jgi:hypothetical protein
MQTSLHRGRVMGAASDATTTKAEMRGPDEEKAWLEGLIIQQGPPSKAEDEPSPTTATITLDSDLPKVSRGDPGV